MQENSTDSFNQLTSRTAPKRVASRWKPIALTATLLVGLVGVALFVFRHQLIPATEVEAARVVLLESATGEPSATVASPSTLLFQASGWIEPDPWPVRVAVLTDGFIESINVEAGDPVTNGQVLAQLDATDNRLALEAAELDHRTREAALRAHRASIEPVRAKLAAARAQRESTQARLREAEDTHRRIQALDDRDTSATERIAAAREETERRAEADVAEAQILELEQTISSMEQICVRMEAQVERAQKQVEIHELALARTVLKSPMDGRVMERFVEPGAKRMAGMDDPNSATVVSLYDPASLRVRVDVPLAEAGRLHIGMPARISTAMIPETTFTGTVTRIVGEADLQRNTLQAKVAIVNPDPRMRPEVLCRVEFMGDGSGPATVTSQRSLWVPVAALDGTTVWVIDPDTYRASPTEVRLGREERDGLRRVHEGLLANQWVVTQGARELKAGDRVRLIEKGENP